MRPYIQAVLCLVTLTVVGLSAAAYRTPSLMALPVPLVGALVGPDMLAARTGTYTAGQYQGQTILVKCTNDGGVPGQVGRGTMAFVISTGGSTGDRTMVCSSTENSTAGYGWRQSWPAVGSSPSITVGTALAH